MTEDLKTNLIAWRQRATEAARLARDRGRAGVQAIRRHPRWLFVPPVLVIAYLAFTYLTVARTIAAPPQVILGVKGIEVLDRNGQVLYQFNDNPGPDSLVSLNDVPRQLIDATVATEDAGFWSDPGISLKGLLRAAYENLAFWKHGGFFKGSGGSSITQQLAKNLYIDPGQRASRNPIRKVKEMMIALELERRYSKQQILEWYLSDLPYGHGAFGVRAASYLYFNRAPKDLTLAQAALLAGIPRAPALYDPLSHPDAAKARQQQVLDLMVEHHLLSKEDAQAAADAPLDLQEGHDPQAKPSPQQLAPHFAVYVRELLPSLVGKSKASGQLRITTTLDAKLQQQAETVVKSDLDSFEKQYSASNGALVSMDPRTGEILAMVGSHDFSRDDISGQVNNALALRQPGSTLKPVTYLTAFLKGWAPATIVVDEPLQLTNGDAPYTVNNADGWHRGPVPIREALGSSLNVPAVKTLEFVGLPDVYAMARRLGITSLRSIDNYGPAFTLGGVDVNLLDMTYVYSVFANEGQQAGISSVLHLPSGSRPLDPVAVLKVETAGGKVLYQAKEHTDRLVPANAVYLLTNVLSDDSARVSMFGANSALNLPDRPSAAKSGTSDATRDAWTIGYTPQLVTGVWVGNANEKPMVGATSTNTAARIWQAFMTGALKGQPVLAFRVPDGVESAKVCATTGLPPGPGCPKVVTEVFLAGHAPKGATNYSPAPANQPTLAPAPTERPQPTPTFALPTTIPPPRQQPVVTATPVRSTPVPTSPAIRPTTAPTTIPLRTPVTTPTP